MVGTQSSNSFFTRTLCALYGINLCAGMSMAIFGMLTATWMQQSGHGSLVIGVVSACYYLLQILGAPVADRVMRGSGVRSALILGLALATLASPLFAFTRDPLVLGLVRGAAGLGVGICVTAAQTALINASSTEHRGLISGLHALAFALGLALGPLLGPPLYEIAPKLAALLGGFVFAVALGTGLFAVPAGGARMSARRFPVAAKLRVPLHAIFAYGFAEGTLFALYPTALVQRGSSVQEVGFILSTFVAGSIVCTLPVARLGDRFGRQRVLLACALIGVVSMLGLWTHSFSLMVLLAFAAGGSVGSSYAISMALVADPLSADELPSGMALFTVALGAGCVAGPLVTGGTLAAFGNLALFIPTALVFMALLPRLSLRAPEATTKPHEVALEH
jgi:MFS family permease